MMDFSNIRVKKAPFHGGFEADVRQKFKFFLPCVSAQKYKKCTWEIEGARSWFCQSSHYRL